MSSNPALVQAASVVREVAAAEVPSDEALAGEVEALRRLADVAEAAYAVKLREFDARGVSETQEVLTTKQWARHHLNVATGVTGHTLRVAKKLAKLPVVEAALAEGTIRWPHASAIADLTALFGDEVVGGCQDALVDAAAVNDPVRFRLALRGMGLALDSKNAKKKARKQQQGRWLDVAATFEGAVSIDGMLDAETGAIVQAAIDTAAKPTGAGDLRTAAQRRADALVDICRGITASPAGNAGSEDNEPATATTVSGQARPSHEEASAPADGEPAGPAGSATAASDEPATVAGSARVSGAAGSSGCRCGGRGARPSITVVCDLDTLLTVTGGFGELPNGHIVPGDTMRRMACDASITRVVVGPNSQPLDVGRSQRTVTTAQLKALRVRDNGCRFPGCDRPFEWTDAHHIIWWANAGTTDIANLIMLCRKHHTTVHEGGWTVQARPDGEFRFTDPAGITVADTTARTTRDLVAQLIRSEAAHQP